MDADLIQALATSSTFAARAPHRRAPHQPPPRHHRRRRLPHFAALLGGAWRPASVTGKKIASPAKPVQDMLGVFQPDFGFSPTMQVADGASVSLARGA